MNVCANVRHRTIEPIPSSAGLASICRSIGRVSAMGVVAAPGLLRVDRPLRKRRNDSRNVFLNDLRRESASPASVKSIKKKKIIQLSPKPNVNPRLRQKI